jgi:hypothetical protein
MKELQLPKVIEIRIQVDGEPSKSSPLGNLSSELAVIDRNGLHILAATIMIEDRMIEAVSKVLFGSSATNKEKRDFFINHIMSTSDFSYSFKRRAFTRLLEQLNILEPEKIKQLKSGLNKIMEWRNAFAHGKVIHEMGGGFVLRYYSGEHKEFILNDDFFENIESTFRDCLITCNGIIQSQ